VHQFIFVLVIKYGVSVSEEPYSVLYVIAVEYDKDQSSKFRSFGSQVAIRGRGVLAGKPAIYEVSYTFVLREMHNFLFLVT